MKFQVFDCGKPADSDNQKLSKGIGWDNSQFETLEKAQEYSAHYFYPYLGHWDSDYHKLQADIPFEYNDKCFAEIRSITSYSGSYCHHER